ncbi:MAG: hypothetical protein GY951_04500, partial [Psychromonas sp.]|nr:hypothetical protein [Psychromonas sp.]
MDIISHGLWGHLILKKIKPKIKFKTAVAFNILPDILPFGLMAIYMTFTGNISPDSFSPETIPEFVLQIYRATHSLFTFSLFFLILLLIKRCIYWPILGWLIHILIDIPTHGGNDYITKFLYPLSDYAFDGLRWTNVAIISINYFLLAILYLNLYKQQPIKINYQKLNQLAWKILLFPTLIFTLPYMLPLFKADLYLNTYLNNIANIDVSSLNTELTPLLELLFRMGSVGIMCFSILSLQVILHNFRKNQRWSWFALIPSWALFWGLMLYLDHSV